MLTRSRHRYAFEKKKRYQASIECGALLTRSTLRKIQGGGVRTGLLCCERYDAGARTKEVADFHRHCRRHQITYLGVYVYV